MSFDNSKVFVMEEIADMQQEILTMLEDQGRVDLIIVFKQMLDKCEELNYETESTPDSESVSDCEDETIEVKTDKEGFKSIV